MENYAQPKLVAISRVRAQLAEAWKYLDADDTLYGDLFNMHYDLGLMYEEEIKKLQREIFNKGE